MNEVDVTVEVCAVIIPQNGSTVPLVPPLPTGQDEAIIGLDSALRGQSISATISTEMLTGVGAASGNNFSIYHCRWLHMIIQYF